MISPLPRTVPAMGCLLCPAPGLLPAGIGGADTLVLSGPLPDRAALAALREGPGPRLYLRLAADACDDDACGLAAALALAPEGIVLTGVESGRDLGRLASRLAVAEAETGLPDGATCILAVLGSARALLQAVSLAGASRRLSAITWDPEALADDLGRAAGRPRPLPAAVARQARATVVLAAAAAGVPAIAPSCADPERAGAAAQAARRAGFSGMAARSPTEAARIAAVFGCAVGATGAEPAPLCREDEGGGRGEPGRTVSG